MQKDVNVALFMPCRFSVYSDGAETVVKLARPTMISQMIPGAGLDDLAVAVERTLIEVMKASV